MKLFIALIIKSLLMKVITSLTVILTLRISNLAPEMIFLIVMFFLTKPCFTRRGAKNVLNISYSYNGGDLVNFFCRSIIELGTSVTLCCNAIENLFLSSKYSIIYDLQLSQNTKHLFWLPVKTNNFL